jgi:hypothetical protein
MHHVLRVQPHGQRYRIDELGYQRRHLPPFRAAPGRSPAPRRPSQVRRAAQAAMAAKCCPRTIAISTLFTMHERSRPL